ncbi:hypothetical protein, partial [Aphanothece microscopica]|uniref:hypothetical protein n=1 Tax=Aphanothece microscopica TaxID=1049561 RepID=UPI003984A4B5
MDIEAPGDPVGAGLRGDCVTFVKENARSERRYQPECVFHVRSVPFLRLIRAQAFVLEWISRNMEVEIEGSADLPGSEAEPGSPERAVRLREAVRAAGGNNLVSQTPERNEDKPWTELEL